jgi:glycosyltransferase involved in cell wall biosynthesis
MPGPTVDVILPTHRHGQTIGYSVESVLRQTHADLRLHIVGDGCTAEVEKSVGSIEDPRVHFYNLPKAKGYGYANRNHVLRRSAAPYVAYVTDDDLWFPDHLERALATLEQGFDLVAFRSCSVQFPDRLEVHFFAFDWGRRLRRNALRNWFIGSPELVHRRSVLDAAGYWNDDLFRFGDREFYNRVRRSGARTTYVDCITVIRFYALHWDEQYGGLDAPPQRDYLVELGDPEWCRHVRKLADESRRAPRVRLQQWRDFLRFGATSGPKLARYWYQKVMAPASH